MNRENTKAERVMSKVTPASAKKDGRPILKAGPSTGPAIDMDALKRQYMPRNQHNLIMPNQA